MTVCQVGFGKISFATSGLSLSAFSVAPPHLRVLLSKAFKLATGTSTVSYPATGSSKNGGLHAQSVEVPDGSILQIQASRTYRGAKIADAAIFLRTRDTAGTYHCRVNVPPGEGSYLGDKFVAFSGRFDILGLGELRKLGIIPHGGFINGFMKQEEINELFDILELAPEVSARPELVMIEDATGKEQAIFVTPAPKRKIRIAR